MLRDQGHQVFPHMGSHLLQLSPAPRREGIAGAVLGYPLLLAMDQSLHASDAFTYAKVADFAASISPETIWKFALNDNGDVAYVGAQPAAVNELPSSLYQAHDGVESSGVFGDVASERRIG